MKPPFPENEIISTQIGVIAVLYGQFNSPNEYFLHVKDQAQFADVAETLQCFNTRRDARYFVWDLLRYGKVKISTRVPLCSAHEKAGLDLASIPKEANCEVIRVGLYHIVYTPGLFEGKLQGQLQEKAPGQKQESQEESREKTTTERRTRSQSHDHEISH
jgi:hypothetical protein